MIIDSLDNLQHYVSLVPAVDQINDFLHAHCVEELTGRTFIHGRHLYCDATEVKGKAVTEAYLEAHRYHIDLQVPLGNEAIGWQLTSKCHSERTPYDVERDLVFYNDIHDSLLQLHRGMFIILFPTDAHAPCIGNGTWRKLVFKIRVE